METVAEAMLAIAQPDCATIQIIFNMLRHKPAVRATLQRASLLCFVGASRWSFPRSTRVLQPRGYCRGLDRRAGEGEMASRVRKVRTSAQVGADHSS